jgi:cytochrome P450
MSHLTLHREHDRHGTIAADALQPAVFDKTIDSWVITNPDAIRALLRRPELLAVESVFAVDPGELGEQLPNLVFAFLHIPLSSNGDTHRQLRRRMGEIMARNRGASAAAIERSVAEYIGRLEQPGELDLVADVLRPLVADVVGTMCGAQIPPGEGFDHLSLIFDRWISLKRRRLIESEIAAARIIIKAGVGPEDPPDEEGVRLAMQVLGRDALLGTLTESLYRLILTADGRALNAIDYPDLPPETGVAYAERRVARAFTFDGQPFAVGERLRFRMQAMAYSGEAEDRERMFGIGLHACLGRQVSMAVWGTLVGKLRSIPRVAVIAGYAIRTGEYTFTFPETLRIRIF